MAKKKLFISGVAGFLGSHLADHFLAQGCEVIGVDNFATGNKQNVPSGVEFYEYDLCDIEKNQKHLQRVDAVIHTAALAYDGMSVFSPHLVTQNVYSNSVALMSAAVANNVERFVFCSSMARYGEQNCIYTEDLLPKPNTPYGIAKYSTELVLKNLCETHGMEYSICVPHNIIGPRQKFDDPFRNVAAIMINRMLQGKQPYIYGDGSHKRCFSDIRDCLQVLVELPFSQQAKNEIFNIGPDEEQITILELAKATAELLNFKLDPIFLPVRPNEVGEAICSSDKIRKVFSYKTNYNLQDGLISMIEYIRKTGPKAFDYKFDTEINNDRMPQTWREKVF